METHPKELIKFKKFGPNCKKYVKAVALLFDHFKLVENVNFEIEKLTRLYLDNFLERRKNVSFPYLLTMLRKLVLTVSCSIRDSSSTMFTIIQ